MSTVQVDKLSKEEHDQLCVTYAALILHDEGVQISADKLKALINSSDNKVDGYLIKLFAKNLAHQDLGALLQGGAQGGAQTQQPVQQEKVQEKAKSPEKKKDDKKKETKPVEEEEDMGFGGLF